MQGSNVTNVDKLVVCITIHITKRGSLKGTTMLLDEVRQTLENHGNHAKFMSVVSQYFPPDDERYIRIQTAYKLAKEEFRGKYRDSLSSVDEFLAAKREEVELEEARYLARHPEEAEGAQR